MPYVRRRYQLFIAEGPRESTVQRWFRLNFWASALLVCALVVWSYIALRAIGSQPAPADIAGQYPRLPQGAGSGLVFLVLEVVAALLFYRRGGVEARGAAAVVGLFLLAGLAVLAGSARPGAAANTWVIGILLYAIVSHFLYAIAGSSVWRP